MRARAFRSPERGLGETDAWLQLYADARDVYVYRFRLGQAPLADPADAQLVLGAAARVISADVGLDVRGMTLKPLGDEGNDWMVDVVLTSDTSRPFLVPTFASTILKGIRDDRSLRQRFPNAVLSDGEWREIKAPPASLDFWRGHETIWDDVVGPLDAFASARGIYRGVSDQGPLLKAWSVPGVTPAPPSVVVPENGPAAADNSEWWTTPMGLAAVGVLAGATVFLATRAVAASEEET